MSYIPLWSREKGLDLHNNRWTFAKEEDKERSADIFVRLESFAPKRSSICLTSASA